MIAQGRFNPAHLGAIGETVRCVLDEIGADSLEPGDVVLHNDPFRGGCHMPEHMLLRPVFRRGQLVAFAATIGHMAEIGAVTIGSFASTATEVYQEGLRLPPVKLVRGGDGRRRHLEDHSLEPPHTSVDLGRPPRDDRLARTSPSRGCRSCSIATASALALAVWEELLAHGERLMRRRIEAIPDGEYLFEDVMEGDGHTREHVTMRVRGRRTRRPRDRRLHRLRPAGTRAGQRNLRGHGFGDLQRLPPGQRPRDPAERGHLQMPEDDRAAGNGRERPLPRTVGWRQHRDAAEARRDAARRLRTSHARQGDGGRGRHLVQLSLRWQRPEDG